MNSTAGAAEPRPETGTIKYDMPRPLRRRLGAIRGDLADEFGRRVTLQETLERVVTYYEEYHR